MRALDMKERTRTIALSFSLLGGGKDTLRAKNAQNCDCRGGKLKTALGWTQVLKESGAPQVCEVADLDQVRIIREYDEESKTYAERFCALNANGDFYTQETVDGAFTQFASGFEGAGIERFAGTDSRYKLALIGENGCAYIRDDGNFDLAALEGTAKTGCFFRHRMLIGMKPSTLVYSAPEDALDFIDSLHDGGMLRFPNVGGSIVAVKSFEDKLYLFFEYGILRLNVSGTPTEFTVKELEYAGGKIFGRTVVVGSHGLYFLTADGLYRFDGEEVERLLDAFVLPPKEETHLESAAAFSERILMRYMTENGYKTLVAYEDGKDSFYMDELPALSGEEGGRCLFTDENGVICSLSDTGENGFESRFLGAETDLGIAGRKTLTNLRFEGKGSFSLTLKNGGRTFKREVEFQDGVAEVKLSERGERFAFDMLLKHGAEISAMTAEVKTVA